MLDRLPCIGFGLRQLIVFSRLELNVVKLKRLSGGRKKPCTKATDITLIGRKVGCDLILVVAHQFKQISHTVKNNGVFTFFADRFFKLCRHIVKKCRFVSHTAKHFRNQLGERIVGIFIRVSTGNH